MKILLDTHMLLWALTADRRLAQQARAMIETERNDVYYSIVSLWEVELKHLLHPAQMPLDGRAAASYAKSSGFLSLSIKEDHIFALHTLCRTEGTRPHKDPFDRLLICQAKAENMRFVTHDTLLSGYNERCIFIV